MNSIKNLTKTNIDVLFGIANQFKSCGVTGMPCKDKMLCNAFFEPSTRTALSFESAMLRLGGKVINFNPNNSSLKKGESLQDTLKTLEQFCDIMVLRHPDTGSIKFAENIVDIPIINGGNGDEEHPSQALIDLFTMLECSNMSEDQTLQLCIIGDIQYSRTIRSLLIIMHIYRLQCDISLLCYPGCEPDQSYLNEIQYMFSSHNVTIIDNLDDIGKYDVIYTTRRQLERSEKTKNAKFEISKYQLNAENIKQMKKSAVILHPLPRNYEISYEVDGDPRAKYFQQVKNSVFVRMAILHAIIFKELNNTFYTEEYNYQNQLQSEIHLW
jgi:aspartate carbamoyltransferase